MLKYSHTVKAQKRDRNSPQREHRRRNKIERSEMKKGGRGKIKRPSEGRKEGKACGWLEGRELPR